MRDIYDGVKDYIKDVRHDARLRSLGMLSFFNQWKEGSVFHYIRQRRITRKIRKQKGKK